jgi:hypothetical protein
MRVHKILSKNLLKWSSCTLSTAMRHVDDNGVYTGADGILDDDDDDGGGDNDGGVVG